MKGPQLMQWQGGISPAQFWTKITSKTIAYGFVCEKYPTAKAIVLHVMFPLGREIQGLEGLKNGASGVLAKSCFLSWMQDADAFLLWNLIQLRILL